MADKTPPVFNLKNNDIRSFGFAGRLCVAGTGNPTPPEARAAGVNFPARFELTEDEMFRSYRGVTAAMKQRTRLNLQVIEVSLPGVDNLSVSDLEGWAQEHRKNKGWKEPVSHEDHGKEIERAANRPEDPIEIAQRNREDERDQRMMKTLLAVMDERDARKAKEAAALKTKLESEAASTKK